ncbi:hypothetical protein F4804DRAFT_136566 [Jackrogersella minutella]|nr:hypothetical protein F4804DRAFT_136566 [Jackrogersella minutella]
MQRKDEPRQEPSGNQDGKNAGPQSEKPSASSQPTPETTSLLILQRPWVDRQHSLNDNLQQEHGRKVEADDRSALEQWTVQSMADSPYQNVQSIAAKTDQVKPADNQSKNASPISETAATSGSTKMTPQSIDEQRSEKGTNLNEVQEIEDNV